MISLMDKVYAPIVDFEESWNYYLIHKSLTPRQAKIPSVPALDLKPPKKHYVFQRWASSKFGSGITSIRGLNRLSLSLNSAFLNIIGLNLNEIDKDYPKIKNEPSRCAQCGACMNCYSVISSGCWLCCFCCTANSLPIPTEFPSSEILLYDIGKLAPSQKEEDIRIWFLVDISGSMFESAKRIKGKKSINKISLLKKLLNNELLRLKETHPKSKVGIIVFHTFLEIIGDGEKDALIIGQKVKEDLYSIEAIRKVIKGKTDLYLKIPIEKSCAQLQKKLKNCEPNGRTALGPAVSCALEFMNNVNTGSQILIFTDGVANVGIGDLEKKSPYSKQFYELMGQEAKKKGVIISLYLMTRENCYIDYLFPMISQTSGKLHRLDTASMGTNFSIVDANKILGFNVDCIIRVPQSFEIAQEDESQQSRSIYKQVFSVVFSNTILPFEFKFLQMDQMMQPVDYITVQAEIEFTARNSVFLMSITQQFESINRKTQTIMNPLLLTHYFNKIVQDGTKNGTLPNVCEQLETVLEKIMIAPTTLEELEIRKNGLLLLQDLRQFLKSIKKDSRELSKAQQAFIENLLINSQIS